MTPDRLIVPTAGVALVAFIAWHFRHKRSGDVRAAETSAGCPEAMILVTGGHTPDTAIVGRGRPMRPSFRRDETAACSDKAVFEHFGKSAGLPTGEPAAVELMPEDAGELALSRPMGMFRGRLIVEER